MRNDFPIGRAKTKAAKFLQQFGVFVFSTLKENALTHFCKTSTYTTKKFLKQIEATPVQGAFKFVYEASVSVRGRKVFTVYQGTRKLGWMTVTPSPMLPQIYTHVYFENDF